MLLSATAEYDKQPMSGARWVLRAVAEEIAVSRRRPLLVRAISFTGIALAAALAIGLPATARAGQRRTEQARELLDLSEAIRLNEGRRAPEALMYLAPYVRSHPDDVAGRSLLLNILLRRNWPLPIAKLRHAGAVSSAHFSPDGQRVVTASLA